MTTQGERDPLPAGHQDEASAVTRRVRGGGRRRIAVWCALAGVAVGGAWLITRPGAGQLLPGLGHASSSPAAADLSAGTATEPLTEAQAFTADHYFPAQRLIEDGSYNGTYKGHRTAGRQGNDCAETLQDRTHDVLKDVGCQGYLALSYTRADQQVLTSVTVLRFNDDQAAGKAARLLTDKPGLVAFVQPDGTAADAQTAARTTAVKVTSVGHYVTVTASRFADGHTDGKAEPDLADATRVVAYAARLPFAWM